MFFDIFIDVLLGQWLFLSLLVECGLIGLVIKWVSNSYLSAFTKLLGLSNRCCHSFFDITTLIYSKSYSNFFFTARKGITCLFAFLIWASDIGAYLAGKQWGKHKLIPKVSPGKSWEGVTGGVILAMIVATLGYYYFIPYSIYIWFGLALSTVVISIFGDLFISILKRRCQLKDTGNIIPGHGGILDRLDSLIAALPWFYFGLTYIPLGI